MVCVVARYLFPKSIRGFALYPFIVLKYKVDRKNLVFLNHEKIHLRQQLELLILPFLIWYVLEFIIRLLHYKNWNLAYRNICFEKEAYRNEKNLDYLKKRPFFGFFRYL